MSIVVAVSRGGCCAVASDSAVTYGDDERRLRGPKIVSVGPGVLAVGVVGMLAHVQALRVFCARLQGVAATSQDDVACLLAAVSSAGTAGPASV